MINLKAMLVLIFDLFKNKEKNEFLKHIEAIGAANAVNIMKHFKESDQYELISKAFKVISGRADELLSSEDPTNVVTMARLQVWKDLYNILDDVVQNVCIEGLEEKMAENLKKTAGSPRVLL